jgi:major membrane immunogen (membrane-anchored lipoprotein)
MKGRDMKMKKKMAIVAMLLVAALLLASCAGQNSGEKKLTTGDIEGTWTVSDKSVQSKEFLALDGFILKPDDSAILVLRGGKITWEWQNQEGKQTSEAGAYEVIDGDVLFSSVKLSAKLEGKTLTLTEYGAPKGEGVFKLVDGVYTSESDPSVTEVADKAILVLERK